MDQGPVTIPINNLPEINESKSVNYNADPIMGRASPLHSYHYSDTRNISIQFHFFVLEQGDIERNLSYVRAIRSASYPRDTKLTKSVPFLPPPICKLRCGNLLAVEQDICVVLNQCSITYPTDVPWDWETMCPYRIDVNTTWWEVYSSPDLPNQDRIYKSGR
jgi:hypothetical protein